MRFLSQYIENKILKNFISKLNTDLWLTIIVATEKEGDKLHYKKTKIVAIIIVLASISTLCSFSAHAQEEKQVLLGGKPFGLKLFTNGVIVIDIDENDSAAQNAGIKINDIIVKAHQTTIENNEQLKSIIENSNGNDIKLEVNRNNKVINLTLTPQKNNQNEYVAGMWIRDSTAGIGTITYYNPKDKSFGALGHGICDKDTGMLMPLKNGEITLANISHVTKANDGVVGGLNGYFDDQKIGSITINNGFGIYGNYDYADSTQSISVAKDDEIKSGDAYIYSTISGDTPKKYKVKISKLNFGKNNGQNMIVTVTDEQLLEKTGGIIQGMSGSPIIQNKKLVGALTHVFVNSPEKGYGISISNMLSNYEQFN